MEALPDGKQPYAIARQDGTPVSFAGIWEAWRAPDGEVLRTFAILTTTANGTMAQLHDRMPVILEPDQWSMWLCEAEGDAMGLMQPAADDILRLWSVSRAVNSVRNNGADLLDRIYAWLWANFIKVCRARTPRNGSNGLRWDEIAQIMEMDGVVGSRGDPPNANSVRRVWDRVWRDKEREAETEEPAE